MLWSYLHYCYPELLLQLHQDGKLSSYLEEKVESVVLHEIPGNDSKAGYLRLEGLVKELTADLGMSNYRYVYQTLKEEFPREFKQIEGSGLIVYHVLKMLACCRETFETFGGDQENETALLHLVIENIQQYLGAKHGWQHL